MWSPRGYQRGPRPPMICFNCRGQGHIARFCPMRRTIEDNGNRGRREEHRPSSQEQSPSEPNPSEDDGSYSESACESEVPKPRGHARRGGKRQHRTRRYQATLGADRMNQPSSSSSAVLSSSIAGRLTPTQVAAFEVLGWALKDGSGKAD
eukprot:6463794-Amphidinium_carterae.1